MTITQDRQLALIRAAQAYQERLEWMIVLIRQGAHASQLLAEAASAEYALLHHKIMVEKEALHHRLTHRKNERDRDRKRRARGQEPWSPPTPHPPSQPPRGADLIHPKMATMNPLTDLEGTGHISFTLDENSHLSPHPKKRPLRTTIDPHSGETLIDEPDLDAVEAFLREMKEEESP